MSSRTVFTCDRCREDVQLLKSFVDTASADNPEQLCREAELCSQCTRELLAWLGGLLCKSCGVPLARCAAARLAGKVKCCPDCHHPSATNEVPKPA